MGFKDDLQDDLDNTFFNKTEFAEDAGTALYTPKSGGQYEIGAIFDNEFEAIDPDTQATVISRQPIVRVNESDLQAPVQPGDKIQIRSITYNVTEPQPDGVGTVIIMLHEEL